jgi:hypothetical protein
MCVASATLAIWMAGCGAAGTGAGDDDAAPSDTSSSATEVGGDAVAPPTDAATESPAGTGDAAVVSPDADTGGTDARDAAADSADARDADPGTPDARDGGTGTPDARDGGTGTPDVASDRGEAGDSGPAAAIMLYYLDVQGRVMIADAEAPMPRALVSSAGQGPDGIAVDEAGGFVYWTGMGVPADDDGFVRRARLDGSGVTTIVPAGGTYTPKQLRLDEAGGKLYWSDREGMKIQRANVDGSAVETLLTVATGATARADASNWCVGMALDLAGGWFYWTQKGPDNGGVGSIRRAHIAMPAGQTHMNRTDVEVLFAGLPEPIDLDLDLDAGLIYWTDRGDDTINRAPIEIPRGSTAATRTDRQIIVRGVREAIGVTIDRPRARIFYTGASGQVGRAGLDGTGARDLLTGAGALTGIAVVETP